MFRKSLLAIAAAATVGAAALAPTAASAKMFHHGHHWHGFGGLGITIAAPVGYYGYSYSSCYRYRWVETRWGLRRLLVNVCD
jgi:hypothetical protein